MGHIQRQVAGETPRTVLATQAAQKLRTWVGRSVLMSQRMGEVERELYVLRKIVQHRHPPHEGKCELCEVLYPMNGED